MLCLVLPHIKVPKAKMCEANLNPEKSPWRRCPSPSRVAAWRHLTGRHELLTQLGGAQAGACITLL